jgi:hypothetical protein
MGKKQDKYNVRLLEQRNVTKGKQKSTHNYNGSDNINIQTDFAIKI